MQNQKMDKGLTLQDQTFAGLRKEIARQQAYARISDFRGLIHRLPDRPPFMLDRDVAAVYGVPTKQLMQQARRNMNMNDPEFLFQLTNHEYQVLRSQNVTANEISPKNRALPHGFTQLGANKIAFYLRSAVAQERSTQILKAFIRVEQMLQQGELIPGPGIAQGLALSGAIQRTGMSVSDVAAISWFRHQGLTQSEVAKLFDVSLERVKSIEKALRRIGVLITQIHAGQREARMWRHFNNLISGKGSLPTVPKGGACQ